MKKIKTILLVTVMVISGWYTVSTVLDNYNDAKSLKELEVLQSDKVIEYKEDAANVGNENEQISATVELPDVDVAKLLNINKDYKFWIYQEGTSINYPIVQGKDNLKYVGETFSGELNRIGTPFLDTRSNDDVEILHAHNYKARNDLFSTLVKYKNIEYREANPYFYKIDNGVVSKYEVFAVNYLNTSLNTFYLKPGNIDEYIKKAQDNDKWSSPAQIDNKKILVLSTCDYTSYGADGRVVVYAAKTN